MRRWNWAGLALVVLGLVLIALGLFTLPPPSGRWT
jgi:hypothetical protein